MTSHLSPSRTARRMLAVPVVAITLLALTSCGDDTVPVSADTGSAADRTGDQSPQPGDEISTDDLAGLLADAVAKGKDAGSARVSLDAGEENGLSGEGEIDFSGDTLEGALKVDSQMLGGAAEVRSVDGVLYVKVPMFGDKFIQIDPDDPQNPLGAMLQGGLGGGLGGLGGLGGGKHDLDSMLTGLKDAVSKATYVGVDQVDGESLSHYAVEIDPTALVDDAKRLDQVLNGKTLDVDLWFDADGYLRKVATDAPQIGAVELSLSGWGDEVTVEAPPADQVTDFSGMSLAG